MSTHSRPLIIVATSHLIAHLSFIATSLLFVSSCANAGAPPASKPAARGQRINYAHPHTVSFTKNGKQLAVGEWLGGVEHKNSVRIYDTATREQRKKLPVLSYTMAMSPSDDTLFTGFVGAGYVAWDLPQGKELRKVVFDGSGPGKVAISTDGAFLAYGCLSGFISLYDTRTDKCVVKVPAHEGRILAMAFSQNGQLLASSSEQDFDVRVWSTKDLTMLHSLGPRTLNVLAVAFSPDGSFLVAACKDYKIRIYDTAGDFKLLGFLSHKSLVRDVAFAKDGTLASCSHDNTVRLWNVRERKELKSLKLENGDLGKLAFSPTEDLLAIALPPRLVFWYHKTGEQHEIRQSPGMINGIALPNDETFELPEPPDKPKPDVPAP